jgi:hypothetical protein
MPVNLISNILPKNREQNVSNDSFFYILDSANIDFKVQGIQENSSFVPVSTLNNKYIIKNASSLNASFGTILGLQNNDIVRYTGSAYELYLDVSNSKTDGGTIVYNGADTKNYVYNGTEWALLGTDFSGITGTQNQIIATTSAVGATLSLSPNVIIVQSLQTPILIFANGITFGGVGDAIQLSGNIHITGNLIVDGEIVTKTAVRGYTFDADVEQITDMAVDSGDYT